MEEEIKRLKQELMEKGIDVEKALDEIYATLSFYINVKKNVILTCNSD